MIVGKVRQRSTARAAEVKHADFPVTGEVVTDGTDNELRCNSNMSRTTNIHVGFGIPSKASSVSLDTRAGVAALPTECHRVGSLGDPQC